MRLRLVLFLFLGVYFAASTAVLARPIALVIGNGDYKRLEKLQNAVNDARAVNLAFTQAGYETLLLVNATRSKLIRTLAELRILSTNSEKVVVYYAGHGTQIAGENYLYPIEGDGVGGSNLPQKEAIPLGFLIKAISERPRQKILFWDACRDAASLQGHGAGVPTFRTRHQAGLFILYSAQDGALAYEGSQRLSPFANALVQTLKTPSDDMNEISRKVRLSVIRSTAGRQIPWTQSSLLLPSYLWLVPRS